MVRWVRAEVRPWVRPGSAGQIHDGRDEGVGGSDGYAEAGRDLRERVVPAKGDLAHESRLVGRELTALVTRTGDDEHGYPLDQGLRQVECGRTGHQRGLGAVELRRRAPLSTARDPRELRVASCGSLACPMISGHSERAQWLEGTMRALGAYASTASPSCGRRLTIPWP
jgi:hypothetical protein